MKKFLFDLFPLILFFAAYKFYDLYVATGVAMIASVGQLDAQAPQSMHLSGSMTRASFFSLIADTGHSPSQAPQLTQASVILYAMAGLLEADWTQAVPGNRDLPPSAPLVLLLQIIPLPHISVKVSARRGRYPQRASMRVNEALPWRR